MRKAPLGKGSNQGRFARQEALQSLSHSGLGM